MLYIVYKVRVVRYRLIREAPFDKKIIEGFVGEKKTDLQNKCLCVL